MAQFSLYVHTGGLKTHSFLDFISLLHQALHPRPGQPYPARVLTCWIKKPAEGGGVPEGAEVAALMKRAFDARLLFIVSGNQICWHGAKFWLTT